MRTNNASIGKIAMRALRNGKTTEQTLAAVRKAHPNAKTTARAVDEYRVHVKKIVKVGTRKQRVFDAFHIGGPDAAMRLGLALGILPSSVRTWVSTWRRLDS